METNCGEVNSHSSHQADVHIKGADMSTEYEIEEEIIIKDEIEIGEESITTNTSKRSLELIPVVYTTRLDDMLIIKKDFESLTIDDIVENILLESKPKFTQTSNQKNIYNAAFDSQDFFQLSEKIRRFNELTSVHYEEENESSSIKKNISVFTDHIKSESSESEEDFVPLKLFQNSFKDDISKEKKKKYQSKRKNKIYTPIDKPNNNHNLITQQSKDKIIKPKKTCKIILAPTCKTVFFNGKLHTIYDAHIKKQSFKYLEGVLYKIGVGRLLMFRYLKRNLSEVMFLMKTGLYTKTFNSINTESIINKSYKNLKYDHPDTSAIYVDICCWFRREHVLHNFLWSASVNPKIFRKEHSCPSPLLCDCCCKNKYNDVVDNKKILPKPLPQSSVRQTLVLNDNDSSDCNILPVSEKEPVSAAVDSLSGVQILKDDMSEFYELKSDRIVVKHVEIRSEHSDMRNKAIKLNADSDKVFCCWYKRDAMIKSFEFKDVPMITQFIRTPHPCPVDYCTCCCKPNSVINPSNLCDKVDYLSSSNYTLGLARNYMSIAKRRRQFVTKPKNIERSIVEPARKDLSNKAMYSGNSAPIQTTSEKLNKSNETLKSSVQQLKKAQVSAKASPRSLSKKQGEEGMSIIQNFVKENVKPRIMTGKVIKQYGKKKVTPKPSTSTNVTTPTFPMPMQVSNLMQINKTEKEDNANPTATNVTTPGFPMPIQIPSAMQTIKTEKQIPPPLGFQQPLPPKQPQLAVPQYPIQSGLGINSILPSPSNAVFPDSVMNDTQNDTVKSLVNGLLHKFNDVRLIITPEGNVSAEIKKPIHTLSTSELQILSKILSHAKEQVKELKAAGALNSATNTVLNPWPNNLNMNTNPSRVPGVVETPIGNTVPVTTKGAPTTPPIIANVDLTVKAPTPGPSSSNASTIPSQSTTNKQNFNQKYTQIDAFKCYTNLSALKMKEYLTSCRYYLNDVKFTPQIKNVYSLNETVGKNVSETQKTSRATLTKTYSRKTNDPKPNSKGVKRKQEQTAADVPKKLKTVTNKLNTTKGSGEKADILNAVPETNQVATLTPVIQPRISPISTVPVQTISPVLNNNVQGSPMLHGMLNTPQPHLVPTNDIPNQLYIAVPFGLAPGGVLAPIVTTSPYAEQPSTSDVHVPDAGDNDDDCILGF